MLKPAPPPDGLARLAAPRVELRQMRSHLEFEACLALQRETWGESFGDLVPPSILKVSQRIGGVSAGAFDESGRLLGFVFGMTGVERGRVVHWSDMLAVRAEARNLGLGRRLKEYQRELLRPLGVELIYWTYDPLVARNAHLNLNRLGARVAEYVEDMYGESESILHRGMGTDRFVVAWPVAEGAAAPAPAASNGASAAPVVNGPAGTSWPDLPKVRVEIPDDIQAVKERSVAEAARWRAETRAPLQAYLARGYRVDGLHRDAATGRCHYHLSRP